MKQILTLCASILVLQASLFAQTQYPLNGGVENWTTGTFGASTYDSLIHWDTPQRLGAALSVPDTVTRPTEIANTGSLAVRMETKLVNILGLIETEIPGSISTGTFFVEITTQEFGVTGGMMIDCTPDLFSGFYQYMPSGVDTANIQIYMMDAAGDTIADASLAIDAATTSGNYEPVSVPITYTGTTDPVMAQILVTSSGVGGVDGSTLYFDDMLLSGNDCFVGLLGNPESINSLELMPNPVQHHVRFELPEGQQFSAAIVDMQGRVVLQNQVNAGMNSMDVSGIAPGFYLLRVLDEGSRQVSVGKFEKF
jgi:hypothetical protein